MGGYNDLIGDAESRFLIEYTNIRWNIRNIYTLFKGIN